MPGSLNDPGMRFFALASDGLSSSLVPPFAQAQDARRVRQIRAEARRPETAQPRRAAAPSPSTAVRRLAKAEDEREAKGISALIERRWARSGSDTADLLLSRAAQAAEKKDYPARGRASRPGHRAPARLGRSLVHSARNVFYQLDDPVARHGGPPPGAQARTASFRRLGRPRPDLHGGRRQGARPGGLSPGAQDQPAIPDVQTHRREASAPRSTARISRRLVDGYPCASHALLGPRR